jgi:hypothetical protein
MLSPQHNAIQLLPVPDSEPGQGFLAIDVAPSDSRPHMSVSEKRYFRRGSDGTRTLAHSEIRELMLATREGSLEIKCNIQTGVSSGDLSYQILLILTLRNVGKIPVRAPYVRVMKGGWNVNRGSTDLRLRNSAGGVYGIYASRDVLVHLEDEIGMAEHETGLTFRGTGQRDLRSAISAVKKGELWHSVSMLPWNEMHSGGFSVKDRTVSISGFYGAENAPVTPFNLSVNKPELFRLFCIHMSIT